MIQHTYDVQTFDDGNKIIRPALSNEYEALLGCLIDFPDLMERSVDIVIDGEAEIYNTAGNVFSADIEKEITVITCYLVDDYEPLCVSTEDLKKLLYEWNNIRRFKKSHSKLYDILLAELEAGNKCPNEYKLEFDVATHKFDASYRYDDYTKSGISPVSELMSWYGEIKESM